MERAKKRVNHVDIMACCWVILQEPTNKGWICDLFETKDLERDPSDPYFYNLMHAGHSFIHVL